jgi:AraC-like DNA-binding protein
MCTDEKLQAQPITDYAFLIYEFFSTNYSGDVKLADLADILHLSERQTERLVIEHTGKTFKEEITSMRMEMAQKLISAGMPLTEIAQYVGYKSYAGFYKAMKKVF